jgi:hypothetical protein
VKKRFQSLQLQIHNLYRYVAAENETGPELRYCCEKVVHSAVDALVALGPHAAPHAKAVAALLRHEQVRVWTAAAVVLTAIGELTPARAAAVLQRLDDTPENSNVYPKPLDIFEVFAGSHAAAIAVGAIQVLNPADPELASA